MKKNILIILFLAAVLCGCTGSGSEASIKMVYTSESRMNVPGEGGKVKFAFASALDWYVQAPDEWITVTPDKGGPGTASITIEAAKNEDGEVRTAVVNVCSEDVVFPVTITQEVYKPTFEILDGKRSVSSLGGEVTIYVNTDLDYEFSVDADWIIAPETKAPSVSSHMFVVEPNPMPEERTAVVHFDAGECSESVIITQRAAGTEADDWQFDDFAHRSLAMRFTADWCGYCPYMATAFTSAKSKMGGMLELVSLHGGESSYEFDGTSALEGRLFITQYPTGIVDLRASIPNYSSSAYTAEVTVDVVKETEANYPTYSAITCSSTLNELDLEVDVKLYLKEKGDYRLVVLVLEDNIIGYQSGAGANYDHDDVARLAVTSMSGDEIQAEGAMIWTKSYSAKLSDKWNKDNLRILMYVEKAYGNHSKVRGVDGADYGAYGNYYIDNCRAVKVGVAAELEVL